MYLITSIIKSISLFFLTHAYLSNAVDYDDRIIAIVNDKSDS
jgi:hypothetical protein